MSRQESGTDVLKHIDEATQHIDVVASWESLNETYDSLRLTDQLSDAERLEEYKWIVQQMNSFLSKTRTKLLSCKDTNAMIEVLGNSMIPAGKVELSTRRALVYQKLRQQWMKAEIMILMEMNEKEEEEQDGWQL